MRGPSRLLPSISGAYGGHTIDFRRFAAEGITLLGRVTPRATACSTSRPISAKASRMAISTYADFLDMADAMSSSRGLDLA